MPTFSLSASALNAEVVSVDLVSLPTRTYYENDSVFTGPWDLNGCVLEVTFTDETTRTIDCSEDLYKTGDYDFTNYGFFSGEYSDPSDANEDYYFISYETVWDDNEGMDVVGFNLFFNTSGNSYPIGTINLENSNVTDFELVYSPEPEIDLATDSFYCVEYGNDTDN